METMTIEEACQFLGVSRMTLTRRIKEGLITPLPKPPGLKIHRRLEFKREDIEKLAKA
jgi:excisionase family DNA binding protein